MKAIQIVRKIASFLISMSILTVILTIVQPMHPEVDKMFRVGAGITFVVCLGLLFGLKAIENKIRQ
jgi:predicted ABC-type exoprotein transport system permease subunit